MKKHLAKTWPSRRNTRWHRREAALRERVQPPQQVLPHWQPRSPPAHFNRVPCPPQGLQGIPIVDIVTKNSQACRIEIRGIMEEKWRGPVVCQMRILGDRASARCLGVSSQTSGSGTTALEHLMPSGIKRRAFCVCPRSRFLGESRHCSEGVQQVLCRSGEHLPYRWPFSLKSK